MSPLRCSLPSRLPFAWLSSLACGAALSIGLPAQAQDLLSAYRFALGDDRRLAATAAQLEGSRARLDESRAASRPHALLRAGTSWSDETYRAPKDSDRYNANGYGLVLTQSLFDRASAIQQDQAALGIESAELRRRFAQQDLMLRVAQAYVGVLQARARSRALAAQVDAATAQRDRVQRLLSEGAATQPDAEEGQARVDAAQAQWIAAQSEQAVRLEALRQLAGPAFEPRADLRPDALLQPSQPADAASWAEAARQDNFEVRAALLSARHATREIDRQRATSLPTLELVGVHGRFAQHGGIIFGLPIPSNVVRQTTVGLQLTLPLATGGAIDGRVRQALASQQLADDLAEEARRQAALAARQACMAISTGVERIRAEERALASSRAALRSTQLAFEVGKRLNSDVLNAQQQLAAADQRWQQARYDTLLAQLQLQAVVGALDEAELERANGLLSPAASP